MADTWLTIEQAAVTLGLSVRTVNRHIVAGKLPSRLQDGRREVLVQVPADRAAMAAVGATVGASAPRQTFDDSPFGAVLSPFASDAPSVTGPAIAGHATVTIPPPSAFERPSDPPADRLSDRPSDAPHHSNINAETVLALADNANEKAELAVSAYQALARATDVQFQHVRRSARWAWASVAVMGLGVSVAVGWTTHHLTKQQVQSQFLREQIQAKAATADTLSAERETLRAELSAAKEEAARADGKADALSDATARLEGEVKDARTQVTDVQTRLADAQVKEAQARAEWQAMRDAAARQPAPATQPVRQPADDVRVERKTEAGDREQGVQAPRGARTGIQPGPMSSRAAD